MSKERSLFQETLVGLYLRLNGYFQTGYIPHSTVRGQAGTDFDRCAIRFPKHSQPERVIGDCPVLKIPHNTIDIIIAEVKNSSLSYNDSIKSLGSRSADNWDQLLRWCGLFDHSEIQNLTNKLRSIADLDGLKVNGDFQILSLKNEFGTITIRPILFSIESAHNVGDTKIWINGEDMIQYIWDCLCPIVDRLTCETRYPFELWGFEYFKLVKFFKDLHKNNSPKPTTQDCYNYFTV